MSGNDTDSVRHSSDRGKQQLIGGNASNAAAVPTRDVRSVVVVPWHPHDVCEEERIALKSIRHYAEGAELVVATPKSSSIPPYLRPSRIEVFPAFYFETFLANNRLMTSEIFYRRFQDYDQMLLVHADVLLLKPLDPLLKVRYPWSYAGAPWVGYRPGGRLKLECVGNGGFSMRRIPDFLDVLTGSSIPFFPQHTTFHKGLALWACLLGCHAARFNRERLSHVMNRHEILEDVYWSKVAQALSRRYTVAPIREAMALSYESFPAYVHSQNHGRLPYGVHAWWRFDVDFVKRLAAL